MQLLSVPTRDGVLRVALSGSEPGSGAPVVLAVHGLAANRATWRAVGRALGDDVCLLAPDLRGRGASRDLGPPYGITLHVDDLVELLDHLAVERAVVVGSSMGCYVGAALARLHPGRVQALVLVDALLPRPMPSSVDLDAALDDDPVVGGVLARLAVTAASADGYRGVWRGHPAFAGTGIAAEDVDAYSDADMAEPGPPFRSAARPDAIRGDARELRQNPIVRDAVEHVACPVWVLRATRGLRNEETPFVPAADIDAYVARHPDRQVSVEEVADTNHFSIALSGHGASAVAAAIRDAVVVRCP